MYRPVSKGRPGIFSAGKECTVKKILLALLIPIAATAMAAAQVFVDGAGTFIGTSSSGLQLGGAAGIGTRLAPGLSMRYLGQYTTASDTKQDFIRSARYTYINQSHLVGLEYIYVIDAIRLGVKASLMAGYGSGQADVENRVLTLLFFAGKIPSKGKQRLSDEGVSVALTAGVLWYANQVLAPFAEVGYFRTMYNKTLLGYPTSGVAVYAGVRLYVNGARRLDEDI